MNDLPLDHESGQERWERFRRTIGRGGIALAVKEAWEAKGEQGSLVVYADKITRSETDAETGEEAERAIPFMKGYTVFNVEQIEDLPAHFSPSPNRRSHPVPRITRAESFFAATHADIRHGGARAYYSISSDHVQMPPFLKASATPRAIMRRWPMRPRIGRHPSRLNREFGPQALGR